MVKNRFKSLCRKYNENNGDAEEAICYSIINKISKELSKHPKYHLFPEIPSLNT